MRYRAAKLSDISELCYTVNMNANRHIWRVWANQLHRWGLADWVAAVLQAVGPLSLLGAQFVYFGQPFLNIAFPEDHIIALANILEDDTQAQSFVALLKEGAFNDAV